MSARMATTSAAIFIFPSGDAATTIPRAYARLRRPVTANSRPMITATIHAGARSICTSEMSAADVRSLSASGSITWPSAVICFRRRARYPSSQSVIEATPKMAAPTISFGMPRIIRPSVGAARLGTAGAVRYAGEWLRESVIVFNGDVLTQVDLAAVIAMHRERRAKATIVLTPVENPTAYGLVETDADGNIRRFLEKPKAEEITCNTINAGIYVLEPDTFDRIPKDTPWSIERSYFPSLIERRETFLAF